MPRETITKKQGIYATHRDDCPVVPLVADRKRPAGYWSGLCRCKPSYRGRAWDRATKTMVNTPRMSTIGAAVSARDDLKRALDAGAPPPYAIPVPAPYIDATAPYIDVAEPAPDNSPTLMTARETFAENARAKKVRNKKGEHYKRKAIEDIEGSIRKHAEPLVGDKTLNAIERGDIQAIVDSMDEKGLSGSRIRSVVNSLRALYNWAHDRDLATADPARKIRLPSAKGKKRDKVIQVSEFERRLALLPLRDAIAYAIAGYTGARASEIRYALAEHVDLDENVIYLGLDEENAQKSDAALRAVPIVLPLRAWLVRWFAERGAAGGSKFLLPAINPGGRNSGMLCFRSLQIRCDDIWEPSDDEGEPIPDAKLADRMLPHQLRHNFATWADAAGVRQRVRSYLMGHATTPSEGGAAVTMGTYTHVLPEDFEEARVKLDRYFAHRGMQLVKAA